MDIFRRLKPPLWITEPYLIGEPSTGRCLLVTNATSLIGRLLCRALLARGDRLIVLTHDITQAKRLFGPHVRYVTDLDELDNNETLSGVINLAGETLAGRRMTALKRQSLTNAQLNTIAALAKLIDRLAHKPSVLVQASGIGYYGARGEKRMIETDRPGDNFPAELCTRWEKAAQSIENKGVRVCRLRIGLVFTASQGIVAALSRPMHAQLAVLIGDGKQWMSWIHINDLIRLIEFTLETTSLRGAVNATSPNPERLEDLINQLAKRKRVRLTLRMARGLARIVLGDMAEQLGDSCKVIPLEAQVMGFEFKYASLNKALDDLLKPPDSAGTLEVFYDGACPICKAEIAHYRAANEVAGSALLFRDLDTARPISAVCQLDRDTARRRLYVRCANGRVISGVGAFSAIWRRLPKYRWLATVVQFPLINSLSQWLYDAFAAPLVSAWSRRNRARQLQRPHHG